MRRLTFLAALALAGCGPREKVVSVPTPVACVKPDQMPPAPENARPQLNGNAVHDSAVLAVAALQWRDYAGKLAALLKGCGG